MNREFKCKDCKIKLDSGFYCQSCMQKRYDKIITKRTNTKSSKEKESLVYAIRLIKDAANSLFWSTSHKNCFRATFGPGESPKHMDKKYERWKYHRSMGRIVFCELILENGSRPDLIICDNKGNVWIEEILVSEKDENIKNKEVKYPFEVRKIR